MTLLARTGARYARILGVGRALPSRVVDNAEMCTYIDSSDEWIRQRTGIVERRWIADGESVETLARDASLEAIANSGVAPADIDAVIVSTVSYFHQTPGLAPKLAFQLGAIGAAAYDISAACAGFCYAIAQAEALIRSGAATHVLVVGAETLSRLTDLSDRSTAFLFADGAGAVVIGPSDVNGISPVVWGSDGEAGPTIHQATDWEGAVRDQTWPYIWMDGRQVFRWASGFVADAALDILEKSGLTPDDLDTFIPHQANNRITDAMLRHLKLPEHVKVARSIVNYGNNSAASIPIAMSEMLASGEAKSGDTALIIGFGAGLVYAGQVVTLP
ncbi:beta-ketoacyl-ACP synthase III [Propionicicella superfundia]|uniref:beta-ketoacyl-ACP synthase III n=1 Tax=Propionicicella superfundia TaxID=348582 RepID=UPI00041E7CB4|nr:beta-ketoacyl-ACP synthase III [Propionicicella superfundia]